MGWPTAQEVVTQAALELGLSSSLAVADPFASLDPNILQLVAFLNRGGLELVDEHDWSHLRQEWAFNTVAGVQQYQLPPDFRDMVDQTGWNRSSRLPMAPLSAQQWAYLKARNTGVVFNVLFRPMDGVISLFPDASTQTLNLAFEYKSDFWVQGAAASVNEVVGTTYYPTGTYVTFGGSQYFRCVYGGTTDTLVPSFLAAVTAAAAGASSALTAGPLVSGSSQWNYCARLFTATVGFTSNYLTGDTVAAGADYVAFDKSLLVAKLRLLFLQAKGLDWSQADRDYRRIFEAIKGNDVASPVLSLGGAAPVLDPLLGIQNYPITGFGT